MLAKHASLCTVLNSQGLRANSAQESASTQGPRFNLGPTKGRKASRAEFAPSTSLACEFSTGCFAQEFASTQGLRASQAQLASSARVPWHVCKARVAELRANSAPRARKNSPNSSRNALSAKLFGNWCKASTNSQARVQSKGWNCFARKFRVLGAKQAHVPKGRKKGLNSHTLRANSPREKGSLAPAREGQFEEQG